MDKILSTNYIPVYDDEDIALALGISKDQVESLRMEIIMEEVMYLHETGQLYNDEED